MTNPIQSAAPNPRKWGCEWLRPELNPTENIWQYMRDNWLSNFIFDSYDDILTLCCEAWNKLVALPGTITSIGM